MRAYPERTALVYVIGSPGSRTVKIGRTTNLPKRLAEIQRMSPVPLEALWTHPGGHELETNLHRHFRAVRSHGEWFCFKGDPVSLVRAAVEEQPWLRPPPIRTATPQQRPVDGNPKLRAAFAKREAELLAIADPLERYRAAEADRKKLAEAQAEYQALQRQIVVRLKESRPWRCVGELLGISGARAEAIAKGR